MHIMLFQVNNVKKKFTKVYKNETSNITWIQAQM